MANIRSYLVELETRLAPSLDAHTLRERLTEAETHLRDRAQEFEEIGLPSREAEARAVFEFGDPEEYVVDLPRPTSPVAPAVKPQPVPRDLALQLAWSSATLGIVAAFANQSGIGMGAAFAVGFVLLGALFGRVTSLFRLAVLSGCAALALIPVFLVAYEPTPLGSGGMDAWGVRLRTEPSRGEQEHEWAKDDLERFDFAVARVAKGNGLPNDFLWRFPFGLRSGSNFDRVDHPAKARLFLKEYGVQMRAGLLDRVAATVPKPFVLSPAERTGRLLATAGIAGVAFMALLAAAQAVGMAVRSVLVGIGAFFRRLVQPRAPARSWER